MQPTETKKQLEPLSLRELTEILIRHYGLTAGRYNLNVEFHIGAGAFGPSEDKRGPGFAISIGRLGLSEAKADGPNTVDASTTKTTVRKASKKR